MPLGFVLKFFQQFSSHQQYFILSFVLLISLFLVHYGWCFVLLPLSTFAIQQLIARISRERQSPVVFSGRLYDIFLRKRTFPSTIEPEEDQKYQLAIQKECDTYIRTIIARYVCVWYYPFISTDQEFLEDLTIMFNIILNRLSYRVKSLDIHELARLIVNLQQIHVDQYLRALDSHHQLPRSQRFTRSVVKEFSEQFHLHPSLVRKDVQSYLRAIVELFLTDLLPESFHLYSGSRTAREFLAQILTNAIFVPLFDRLSQPRMIYYLIVLLWETDEQKLRYESEENRPSHERNAGEHDVRQSTEEIDEQMLRSEGELQREMQQQQNQRATSHLEKIIYSATILSTDRAYNSMSGAAFTVYIIECKTKSPFTSDAAHDYTIRRRFNEFLNLHKRLQRNPKTSRHCYGFPVALLVSLHPQDLRSFRTRRNHSQCAGAVRQDESGRHLSATRRSRTLHSSSSRIRRSFTTRTLFQRVISNEVLNCSHDVLEFFAYNTDPNVLYEVLPTNWISVPRVDRALLGLFRRSPSRSDSVVPIRERFQLNISTSFEEVRCRSNDVQRDEFSPSVVSDDRSVENVYSAIVASMFDANDDVEFRRS